MNTTDSNRPNKLIKKAGSAIGCKPDSVEMVVERRALNKLVSIMVNHEHPLLHLVDTSMERLPALKQVLQDIAQKIVNDECVIPM